MSKKIAVPIFDGKESITQFKRRMEKYIIQFEKEKYSKILDFVNDWLSIHKIKLSALSDFKKISKTKLLKDLKHNRDILRKYTTDLTMQLKIKSSIEDDTESDEIHDEYIIYFVTKLLSCIDYSFSSRIINNETYYTITTKSVSKYKAI